MGISPLHSTLTSANINFTLECDGVGCIIAAPVTPIIMGMNSAWRTWITTVAFCITVGFHSGSRILIYEVGQVLVGTRGLWLLIGGWWWGDWVTRVSFQDALWGELVLVLRGSIPFASILFL